MFDPYDIPEDPDAPQPNPEPEAPAAPPVVRLLAGGAEWNFSPRTHIRFEGHDVPTWTEYKTDRTGGEVYIALTATNARLGELVAKLISFSLGGPDPFEPPKPASETKAGPGPQAEPPAAPGRGQLLLSHPRFKRDGCLLCGATFTQTGRVLKHLKNAHGMTDGAVTAMMDAANDAGTRHTDPAALAFFAQDRTDCRLVCWQCGKGYRWWHRLQDHLVDGHGLSTGAAADAIRVARLERELK